MRRVMLMVLALTPSAVPAQAVPVPLIDTSQFARLADLANVSATATAANAKAQTAVQPADLTAAAASNLSAMQQQAPTFVANGAYLTRAQLFSTYPASAAYLGKLAHVSDAWGNASTTLVEEYDATFGYYWRPQRTDYATQLAATTGSVTLTPLSTAPVVYLPSTPTGTVTLNLDTANVWPGASFHIYAPPTISALAPVNISGIVGGGTLPLAQGADKIVTYVPGVGWKSN